MSFDLGRIENVMVLAPDKHIGDLALSLGAIKKLETFFAGKKFRLVIDGAHADIIQAAGGPADPLLYPRELLRISPFMARWRALISFIRKMRRESPDIAIDLHGSIASSTLTFLSGAPVRVGRATARRAYFYNRKVRLSGAGHKLRSYSEIASSVGVSGDIGICPVKATADNITSMKKTLLKEGISVETPVACIHPSAGVIYKQWREEGFTGLSDWLVIQGFQVVFVGGKKDIERITKIRSRMKNDSCDLGGRLSLGELIALLQVSRLFIGTDSGPMHLACLSGVPVVALFGPADEGRWGPFTEDSVVVRGTLPCEKCARSDCGLDFQCIRTLSQDSVKEAVRKLMKSTHTDVR